MIPELCPLCGAPVEVRTAVVFLNGKHRTFFDWICIASRQHNGSGDYLITESENTT